ncbi:MAG: hypothetical protein G01um101418_289 [Parcubacteria group bacterium Gr01-1014_18]|nr:MAG: hypothetical protein Greene041636_256 [Parcubacteria group bacterium Greene0416_36]TSC81307.1 MAG: hypothetical protein G01um101418_289 [Parcubacteria group bacterium Gr01-1014_18]TSC99329.1 MAG: hypothetical protein Greene101420_257 [Parcubacteria group bacterium Greene1014_20]TSD06834.1 MAG: hypothetical protein Greene07142_568 [Parcubacteria group bacterium Greene0714_2]
MIKLFIIVLVGLILLCSGCDKQPTEEKKEIRKSDHKSLKDLPQTDSWRIPLKEKIHHGINKTGNGIEYPTVPKIIYQAFPLIDDVENQPLLNPSTEKGSNTNYGIFSCKEGAILLSCNGIENDGCGVIGGQIGYWEVSKNPIKYGYLIYYGDHYLSITFHETDMNIKKLQLPSAECEKEIVIPQFPEGTICNWYQDYEDFHYGKLWKIEGETIEGMWQRGCTFATTQWTGGKKIKTPEDVNEASLIATSNGKTIFKWSCARLNNGKIYSLTRKEKN